MRLCFLGATQTVTGSKYLLEVAQKRYLIDCGLFQGYKELRLRNREPFPIDPKTIEAVILTHAHMDHSGYLPLLVKQGFKGKIYASPATRDLCEILLLDAGRIQEEEARRANRYGYSKHHPALPLYTQEEAKEALGRFCCVAFDHAHALAKDLSFTFSHSGHILGSSFVTIRGQEKTVVFSGDLGRPHDLLMNPPAQIQTADYLILESTYGTRLHPKEDVFSQLEAIIGRTAARGGSVVIPAFAVGRTQTLLYCLYRLKQENRLPAHISIYLDSPMAQEVTTLWKKYPQEYRPSKEECMEACSIADYVETKEASKRLNYSSFPSIIISASGMAEGGRVLHHLAHHLPKEQNTIVFAGFQAGGTRGDRLLKGERQIKIHGQMIEVRAQIESLDTLSSHADYAEVLQWLKGFASPPKQVFLTHGEADAAQSLKSKIEEILGWTVSIPQYLDCQDLI